MRKMEDAIDHNLYEDLQKKARGKTSLIIVCDDKTVKYGNFLGQLISTRDDKENEIVGVVDGKVEAAVWTEKEYKANKVKIPFSQHVLFVGENKVSKEETSSIPILYGQYGMIYGWLGKRAKMLVKGERLSNKEYADFVNYCIGYQSKFENAIMKTKLAGLDLKDLEKLKDNQESVGEMVKEKIKKEEKKRMLKMLPDMLLAAVPIVGPIAMGAKTAVDVGSDISKDFKSVLDQQYRALTAIFYIDGLQKFLEG